MLSPHHMLRKISSSTHRMENMVSITLKVKQVWYKVLATLVESSLHFFEFKL